MHLLKVIGVFKYIWSFQTVRNNENFQTTENNGDFQIARNNMCYQTTDNVDNQLATLDLLWKK